MLQVESESESIDNVIQFDKPLVEKNMGTPINKQGVLKLSIYNLQSYLIASGISKSDYIFLMLQLLYGTDKDLEITPENLIEVLDCAGVTPLGKEKEIKFEVEDIQIEIAKLAKKGLLTIIEVPIQLNITSL